MRPMPFIARYIEAGLFRARWLIAPFYLGLVLALAMLLASFVYELYQAFFVHLSLDPESVILVSLTLIDLSLAANLVIIVVFSGYENFVSKIDTTDGAYRPSWMGTLDFSGVKMKLIGSVVAISVISLLRTFMALTDPGTQVDGARLTWMLALNFTFLASGVMLALMDWLSSLSGHGEKETDGT
ncbi:MAG: YqhA family protein [Alphaproteobacteria bacterium]|nr:YqhA family protein [Alphaproteobacteria bacterium]MDE2110893.1 YqhA family protein [Alphaproteobacteria bacterium]MDE2494122.1 YqhA family protein [Alphaproteobacteria bacterium]